MKQHLLKATSLLCLLLTFITTEAQIGKCKGKYLGNIIAGNVPSNYTTFWNQVTSENASKWGSVEGNMGQYNFGGSDICYNWAKNNNGIFKYHTLIWGAQTPNWVNTAATATITNHIDPYFKAVRDHYAPMGGLKMIDVLNEPVNTPMKGNLKAALTAGYRAEPANAGDINNQYGWAIWCFQVARKYFPDATLLINEYNIEMNWNNCRAPYIAMAAAIKNAPNITDGKKNLIDGVGLQAHGINTLTAANFKACIDEIWNKTGLPIHITEFDATADPNEAKQQSVYSTLVPVAWEHPHVAGITFWGYIQGQTWIGGNKQTGAGGTDSGIIYGNGNDRPAMTWMKQYFAGQPSLSCCPAPGPFANCTTSTASPVVSITAPTNNTVYTEGDNVIINATATITTGSISKVDFYNGTTLLGTDASSPYSYTMTAPVAGNYTITAKATSAANATTTSSAITIQVAKPIYQTGSAPTIDGTIDALWSNFPSTAVSKNNTGTISSAADLSGNWKAMWDATNLYVLVQVSDDVKRNDGGTDVYNDDGVEVYVDMFNTKATTYGANDAQYTFRWNDATAAYEINGHSVAGITRGMTNTTTGYIMEMMIPWATIGGTASVNNLEGFEIMISDDDDGGDRDGKLAWAATTDDTWSNPSLMGTVVLKGLNCTAPTAAITTTTPTSICAGSTVTLNAPTGNGNSYVWKNGATVITGATTSNYIANTSGSYTVQITNAGGCAATSTATTVTVNALPTITQYAQLDGGTWNQVSTATVCAGSTIVLGPQPTLNTGWSWTGPNGYTSTTREITLATVSANQGGVYTASYTDGNTCKATSTFTLTVNAAPNAPTVTTPVAYCQNGTAAQLSATGSNLKWYTVATGGTGVTTAPTPTTLATGTTNYYVSQTTNTCESSRALLAVTVNVTGTTAITTTTPTTFCQGGSVLLTASTGASYKWVNGTTTITGATAQTYAAATAGNYSVEVTNASNCKVTSTATTVTVNALPNAPTVATPITYCQNGTAAQLSATGSNLKWYTVATGGTGVTTAPTPTTSVTGTTNYYVSQTTNTCESSRSMLAVTVNAAATATITTSTPTTFCEGGSVVLTATAGSSYKWMSGGATITGGTAQTYTAATSGNYSVEVTNLGNCKATSTVTTVTVNTFPTATITANGPTVIPQGGSVELTASAGSSYKWFKGSTEVGTDQSYTATQAGVYTVEVTNNNCSKTSAGTNVNMNTNVPSVITIISPTPNATVTGAIDIAVNITDADGSITQVEFLDGDEVIGTSSTAPYTFTWDDPSVGDHTITVRVTDSNGGITTSAPTFVTSGSTTTGVSSSNSISANVYPNPSNGAVYIDTDMDLSNASFMLVDVLGREVSVSSVATGNGATLDVSSLTEGTYIMIIKQDNLILRKKITVVK